MTRRLSRGPRLTAVLVGLAIPIAFALPVLNESPTPRDLSATAHETSNACLRCHPDHYESWRRSFHRTMTQVATPESVKGDFDNARPTFYGVESHLYRVGDSFYLNTVDPEWAAKVRRAGFDLRDIDDQRRVDWRVDLAIGSHHYQQYATRLESGGYIRLPLAWHLTENRWLHMNGVFLQPESEVFHGMSTLWNINCIFCHNTKARPRLEMQNAASFDPNRLMDLPFDSEVEEYGIACEACHGPGEEHTRAHTNAARRYLYEGRADPTIVNPARLSKERSIEVCGHCHSFHLPREEVRQQRLETGDPYTVGQPLEEVVQMQYPESFRDGVGNQTIQSNYWSDGTIKRTSIEYLGITRSPCYERGEMTCLSCHQLHAEEPVDQLGPGMRTNRACNGCHTTYQDDAVLEAHTHHQPSSTGSTCYNCHMPNVVWGLLRGMRSHRVITPRVATTVDSGMPHACNQCHLDQTLGWTQDTVRRWYGEESAPLDPDDQRTVASLVQLLRGDAAQRALSAWSFSWDVARATSVTDWAPSFLLLAMADDYPAVRLAAFRSLRSYHPEIERTAFDYLADPEIRAARLRELRDRLALPSPIASDDPAFVPGDLAPELRRRPDTVPDDLATLRLLAAQDKTPLHISE